MQKNLGKKWSLEWQITDSSFNYKSSCEITLLKQEMNH